MSLRSQFGAFHTPFSWVYLAWVWMRRGGVRMLSGFSTALPFRCRDLTCVVLSVEPCRHLVHFLLARFLECPRLGLLPIYGLLC